MPRLVVNSSVGVTDCLICAGWLAGWLTAWRTDHTLHELRCGVTCAQRCGAVRGSEPRFQCVRACVRAFRACSVLRTLDLAS